MPATPPLEIAVIRNADGWPDHFDALAEKAVLAALAGAKPKIKGAAEISVLLTDDAEQRELNAQWRGKDSSTNVLSFPQIEPFDPVVGILGDITLARETLEREAVDLGIHVGHRELHSVGGRISTQPGVAAFPIRTFLDVKNLDHSG